MLSGDQKKLRSISTRADFTPAILLSAFFRSSDHMRSHCAAGGGDAHGHDEITLPIDCPSAYQAHIYNR